MNKEIYSLVEQLKDALYSDEDVQHYLALKAAIENDKNLQELKIKMDNLHHELCSCKDKIENASFLREQYRLFEEEYNSNPLVKEYKQFKNSFEAILQEIASSLSN